MNDIILSTQNGEPVVSSREVAKNFGKEHKDVLKAINNLVAQNCAAKSMFHLSDFENRGKKYPMYLMNRDGFSLLAMGFTGKEALEWKLKYIQAFNEMEKQLAQRREDILLNILLKGETSMKKIIVGVASVLASALLMAGCNKQIVDLTYEYNWAQLKMPDGTIVEGKLNSWDDYEGDQLQVKIDGVTYLVHSSNVVLRH